MEPTHGFPERPKLRRRRRLNLLLVAGLIALVGLLVLVTPREPQRRAIYSSGTESGLVSGVHERLSAYEGLMISEVMASNATAVTDENGDYSDWIEIWNSSEGTIALKALGLSDQGDSIRFLFPDGTLPADERAVVYCSNTNQSRAGQPFHAKFKLSSVGETVYLYDPNAYLIDSCRFPIMGSDESWSWTEAGFQAVGYFSPGFENSPEGHQQYRESIMVSGGALVINEVMADPLTGLRDDEDELVDWIELKNTTNQTVQLSQYALSDNEGRPLKWRFPEDAVIPAGGYYIVYCTGKDRMDTARPDIPHTNFRISAEQETLVLSDSRGRVVDRVMIDNLPEDCSYGRNDAGSMQVFQTATPGLPNNTIGFYQMDINLRAMNKTGVFISEVMASNDSVTTYPNAGYCDWIEIYNSSTSAVDLSGYGLSDRLTRGRKWQFPAEQPFLPGNTG